MVQHQRSGQAGAIARRAELMHSDGNSVEWWAGGRGQGGRKLVSSIRNRFEDWFGLSTHHQTCIATRQKDREHTGIEKQLGRRIPTTLRWELHITHLDIHSSVCLWRRGSLSPRMVCCFLVEQMETYQTVPQSLDTLQLQRARPSTRTG